MNFLSPFLMSFMMIFLAELGDKTQLLVLSFSSKDKSRNILLGVALGTFFSHGLAIIFGSNIGSFKNETFTLFLNIFTYLSFLLFGLLGFIPKKESSTSSSKDVVIKRLGNLKINFTIIIAISIIVGEIGDKTFLASLGLGLQYPDYKIPLIMGSILGMVACNSIALFFGKLIGNKINPKFIDFLSNIIFIIFGLIGFIDLAIQYL